MSETETIGVEFRTALGKRNSRRLRAEGKVPAVLYGHGQDSKSLSVRESEIDAAVRHGSQLVRLTGALNEDAVIRELQWDTWGQSILHVDLLRVARGELIEVTVPIETRGEAPGAREGGVVQLHMHELTFVCPADSIPEKFSVNINELEAGQQITLQELTLPARAETDLDPSTVLVSCEIPVEEPEEEELAEAGEGEPEVIGRKEEEAEEDES